MVGPFASVNAGVKTTGVYVRSATCWAANATQNTPHSVTIAPDLNTRLLLAVLGGCRLSDTEQPSVLRLSTPACRTYSANPGYAGSEREFDQRGHCVGLSLPRR